MNVNIILIEGNITAGAYSNDKSVHTIHKFPPRVSPGYKILETPTQILSSDYRTEHYRLDDSRYQDDQDDCLIFVEKRLLLDCMYRDDSNNVLVMNEQVKPTRNTFFNAGTTIKSIRSSSKKKLTVKR